ncbi:MAG: transcription elongation factor subunit Spt4 [Candidatus Woesearchaeota archaeon]
MKKKACKICKAIVESHEQCPNKNPNCSDSNLTTIFQGKILVMNPKESFAAQKLDIHHAGEYALKVRG